MRERQRAQPALGGVEPRARRRSPARSTASCRRSASTGRGVPLVPEVCTTIAGASRSCVAPLAGSSPPAVCGASSGSSTTAARPAPARRARAPRAAGRRARRPRRAAGSRAASRRTRRPPAARWRRGRRRARPGLPARRRRACGAGELRVAQRVDRGAVGTARGGALQPGLDAQGIESSLPVMSVTCAPAVAEHFDTSRSRRCRCELGGRGGPGPGADLVDGRAAADAARGRGAGARRHGARRGGDRRPARRRVRRRAARLDLHPGGDEPLQRLLRRAARGATPRTAWARCA